MSINNQVATPLSRRTVGLPLLVGFLARIVAIGFIDLKNPSFWEYGDIARLMLKGYGYAFQVLAPGVASVPYPTALMPPGETVIHYAMLAIFGDNLRADIGILVIHALCGIGFIYFSGKIAFAIFQDRKIQVVTLWLAALYPSFVFASNTFGLSAAVLCINALFIWSAIVFSERLRSKESVVGTGVIFGLAAGLLGFFRAEAPLIIITALFLILYINRRELKTSLVAVIGVFLIYAAVQAPWVVRNYMIFHRVIIGSSSGGFNLWRGNSDFATGSFLEANGNGIETPDTMWNSILPTHQTTPDVEMRWADHSSQAALQWMRAHPMKVLELDVKKIFFLWGLDPYSALAWNWYYASMYAATVLLTAFGLKKLLGRVNRVTAAAPIGLYLITLFCAVYTVTVAIFFSLPRFQIFLVGLYLPIFALGLKTLLERTVLRRTRSAGVAFTPNA